jgi:hypothetical protein
MGFGHGAEPGKPGKPGFAVLIRPAWSQPSKSVEPGSVMGFGAVISDCANEVEKLEPKIHAARAMEARR